MGASCKSLAKDLTSDQTIMKGKGLGVRICESDQKQGGRGRMSSEPNNQYYQRKNGNRSRVSPSNSSGQIKFRAFSLSSASSGGNGTSNGGGGGGKRKNSSQPPNLLLTDAERDVIYRSWRRLSPEIVGIGTRVFMYIFHELPHVASLFPFRDVPLEDLPDDPRFRSHASRFMLAVGAVMEDSAAAGAVFYALGQTHASIRHFSPDYFATFEQAMNAIWRDKLTLSDEATAIWAKIFAFIKTAMQDGYKKAMLAAGS